MINIKNSSEDIKILLVDDHDIVRQGTKSILEKDERFIVSYEASTIQETFTILNQESPDFAIIDITLEDGPGIELIKDIRARGLEFPILVMSMHQEDVYAERVLKAGANGYIMKSELSSALIDAIEKINDGKIYVSSAMQERFLEQAAGLRESKTGVDKLSDRELEVFEAIGNGKTTKEIAAELGLSAKTIETHRLHIKKKLDIASAPKLASEATRWVEKETI